MAAILKTRLTEFNTFCREVNIKRNAQPRKLKPGDPETGCSVGSMKRGKRGRAEVSKMRKAEALQQDRRKMRGQCCLCTDTSVHKEKGITVQGVTSLWLTEKSSFHKKGAQHSGLAPAVLIIIFLYGVFPCIVQRNIVLNRILSFHYFPLQLMLCQHLLPWNTDRVVMVLHLTKCQRQQQELHFDNYATPTTVGIKALQKEMTCLLLWTFCHETVENHEVSHWAKHKAWGTMGSQGWLIFPSFKAPCWLQCCNNSASQAAVFLRDALCGNKGKLRYAELLPVFLSSRTHPQGETVLSQAGIRTVSIFLIVGWKVKSKKNKIWHLLKG